MHYSMQFGTNSPCHFYCVRSSRIPPWLHSMPPCITV